jgi:hypothetical protein
MIGDPETTGEGEKLVLKSGRLGLAVPAIFAAKSVGGCLAVLGNKLDRAYPYLAPAQSTCLTAPISETMLSLMQVWKAQSPTPTGFSWVHWFDRVICGDAPPAKGKPPFASSGLPLSLGSKGA